MRRPHPGRSGRNRISTSRHWCGGQARPAPPSRRSCAAARLGAGPRAPRRMAHEQSGGRRRARSSNPSLDGSSGGGDVLGAIAEASPVSLGPRARRSGRRSGCSPPIPNRRRSLRCSRRRAVQPRRRQGQEAPLMRVLRRAKAEAALLIALADIGGVWPVARVTAGAHGSRRHRARRRRALSPRRSGQTRQAHAERSATIPRPVPATSCWPWARWAATSSTSPATSISSSSSIRRPPGSRPKSSRRRSTCASRASW